MNLVARLLNNINQLPITLCCDRH